MIEHAEQLVASTSSFQDDGLRETVPQCNMHATNGARKSSWNAGSPDDDGEEGAKVWICSKVEKEVKNDGIGTDEHAL
jgi:hypothetical protein